MRLGDASAPHKPGPRSSEGLAEAVPIGARRGTAVLDDVVVPPWLRMPSLRLVDEPSRTSGPGVQAAAPDRSEPAGPSDSPARSGSVGARPATGGSPGRISAPAERDAAPVRPVADLAARRVSVHRPAVRSARPRVVEDTGILGLSRLTRGRVGSRLFTLFFVAVFTLIALQMVLELLYG